MSELVSIVYLVRSQLKTLDIMYYFSLFQSPGFYIFQLIELFEEKASTIESLYRNLLGLFIRKSMKSENLVKFTYIMSKGLVKG